MARFPLRLRVHTTRSRKPREQASARDLNRTAAIVETYINDKFATAAEHDVQQFTYAIVARELNLDPDTVCRALLSAGGRSNGITVVKGDLYVHAGCLEGRVYRRL